MSRETMQGCRVPDGTSVSDYKPGDYGKRGAMWWVCLPTGVTGHLDDRWIITEHDDGTLTAGCPLGGCSDDERERAQSLGHYGGATITVSPSIFDSPLGWHGWLERGVWRSV